MRAAQAFGTFLQLFVSFDDHIMLQTRLNPVELEIASRKMERINLIETPRTIYGAKIVGRPPQLRETSTTGTFRLADLQSFENVPLFPLTRMGLLLDLESKACLRSAGRRLRAHSPRAVFRVHSSQRCLCCKIRGHLLWREKSPLACKKPKGPENFQVGCCGGGRHEPNGAKSA